MHEQMIPMKELAELVLLQLEKGGRANLTVTGFSMLPTLRARRDSVVLVPPADRQRPGDILLYLRDNGQYVLHRIIRVQGDDYICCGDNQAVEEVVVPSQVLAVVVALQRKGKFYPADGFGYRAYAAVCVRCFPVRKYYIALRRRFGRLRAKWLRLRKG